jgi:hypothetical protein
MVCNGSEVDLQTNKYHCGECDHECPGSFDDDPELDLDTPACVAGQCQVAWNFCSDLETFAGDSCESLCPAGCMQNGCQGETLVVRRGVNSVGVVDACVYDTGTMEVQAGYQCADPLPATTASGLNLDVFSCCCAPE